MASLNHIDPLAHDRMNTRRKGNQIPHASALKGSNLLGHRKLLFKLSHGSPIGSGLSNNRKTIPVRRIAIRWGARSNTEVMNRWRRGRRSVESRRHIHRIIDNTRMTSVVEGKMRVKLMHMQGGW